MPEPIPLNPDGPHSPDYTRQVADALAEAVRVLCYATRTSAGGLVTPNDVYDLLGGLETALSRFPQMLGQTRADLHIQHSTGRVTDDRDDKTAWTTVAVVGGALITAAGHIQIAAGALAKAQEEVGHLGIWETVETREAPE